MYVYVYVQTYKATAPYAHSEHRFPAPSSKEAGCRKLKLGVCSLKDKSKVRGVF